MYFGRNLFSSSLIEIDLKGENEKKHSLPPNFQSCCLFMIETGEEGNKGKKIRYGSSVRLMHVAMQRYISATQKIIGDNLSEFKIKMVTTPTPLCYFKITPKLKLRSEGELVFLDDIISLKSVSTNHYLTYSKDEYQKVTKNIQIFYE
jgi:hypothetical protein